MRMEELKILPADIGLRRSSRLIKKSSADYALVIDLADDLEDENWEPEAVRSRATRAIAKRGEEGTGATSCQEELDGTHTVLEQKGGSRSGLAGTANNPIWFPPIFEMNVGKKVEMSREQTNAVSERLRYGVEVSNDDKDDPFATGIDESAFWQEVVALDPRKKDIMDCSFVDASSQQAEVVDLSSSESGDDGDGDMNMGEIAEEQEEISTTLSHEDAALLVEVMISIREGGDLKKFKVEHLKAYLRHHGLRMVGLKAVLLSRIQEHLKIKDGRAEEIYPRSSFFIDCKGKVQYTAYRDVCLGDTVLFLQTVYDTPFDIERRCASGPPLGKRWVAGKVVNESYGAGKQQHTFTIEVLWSTGTRPFYVMRPLQIKGRNLYRMLTLRQPWSNEAERQKVLDEKHARGAEARAHRRAMKSLKSKGRTKSRQEARVHPYNRSHAAEPHTISPQNPVQYASIHTQENVYEGSVPAHPAPARTLSMQHGTYTERTVNQGFTERHPAPEPTVPHGRSFLTQQRYDQGCTETHPAPEPTVPRGRKFHTQPSYHQGSSQVRPDSLRIHVQDSIQHGRIHTQRQVYQGSMASQIAAHSNNGRLQQGTMPTGIPCSHAGCEKLGAKQCITRSCASCCSRNSSSRGRCPRHR